MGQRGMMLVKLGQLCGLTAFIALTLTLTVQVGSASAQAGPAWRITAQGGPTDVAPLGNAWFLLQLENIGDAPSAPGAPITVVDQLPPGLKATEAAGLAEQGFTFERSGLWGSCAISVDGRTVTCKYRPGVAIAPISSGLEGSEHIGANELAPVIGIRVAVEPLASGTLVDDATVSGGGAALSASDTASVSVSSSPAAFGVATFHQWSTNIDGSAAVQAGEHPNETATSLTLNTQPVGSAAAPAHLGVLRNVDVELPEGFVGNPRAVPKCPRASFDRRLNGTFLADCPPDTQIGQAVVYFEPGYVITLPLYNLVPPSNVPAQFGAAFGGFVGFIDATVRPSSGGRYHVVADARDVQSSGEVGITVRLWGVPASSSHDALRIPEGQVRPVGGSGLPSDVASKPFLRLPTSCGVPQTLALSVTSWEEPVTSLLSYPGLAASTDEQDQPVAMEGCSKLDFSPSIQTRAGTSVAESPSGLAVDLTVPQNEDPNGLAEADLKNVSVALPANMTVSPSAANGLEACSEEQIGVTGSGSTLLFNEKPVACPSASKLGTVEVVTPLLEHPLTGALYLAQQDANPFGSLIAVYLAVEGSGVLVKLPGEVRLNQQTGQVTASFLNNPQLPFSEIKVNLFENARSSLMTPPGCGAYTTTTSMTGWNGSAANPSSEPFSLSSNCGQGFQPAFTAGTTNNQAGAFSPFSVTFSRRDGEQRIADAAVLTPPGLSAMLRGVQKCPEPQASNATCGPESQIGHATVAVGPGPEPFYVPANVFLTAPYRGAPLGLSIVTRAKAGPFDLGTVVVRARIDVDPHTAQITVTPDPSGQFAIPTILQGIPLDLRLANVAIDRPGFTFNPTNCSRLSVNGVLTSTSGTNVAVSSPFQAAGCAKLPFKPVFAASSQAATSKSYGASLIVKITKKPGEANLHKVDLQLPIALPARLTTLQKACTEAQFNANPAGCPAASVIGVAKLNTPVLSLPLTGPAFLVSHGGAAFPDVEFVLQGEGVTVIVDGATDIKKGITYSKFETAPDQPFSSFETRLPEGPYSVLATDIPAKAKGSLCGQGLTMPTTLTGQNGAVLTQATKIAVSGCPKAKTKLKPKRKTKQSKEKTAGGAKRSTKP